MLACPIKCWTILGCTPRPRSSVAHVCLRSCQRISGNPARLRSGFRCALRGREYEAVILPLCAAPKLFLYLAFPLAPEGF